MNKYNLRLTAKQIELLKSLTGGEIIEINSKAELKEYHNFKNDLHTKLCYQLSDQQNLPAPLSQREYPQ